MSIVLVRIDDRLIHGQVIEGWLKVVRADTILVASDEVYNDEIQKQLMGIAVPEHIKLMILDNAESAKTINKGRSTDERILVLMPDIETLKKVIENGAEIESVNIGGLHWQEGKKQYLKSISLNEKDIAMLQEIKNRNIELEARALPTDDRIDILSYIKKADNTQK